jgi:benzoylformate decarboxylase
VNFLQQRVETELPPVTRISPRLRGDPVMIEEAALLLASAQNPAIIVGDGCARSGAVGEIVSLAETLAARVHTEPTNSLLVFPTGHPLCDWPLFPSAEQTRPLLEDVDVLLVVGVSTLAPLVYTGTRMIAAGVRIIQIDVNDHEIGKNYPAEIAIHADPRSAIQELLDALPPLLRGMTSTGLRSRRESTAARIAGQRAKLLEQASVAPHAGAMSPAYVAHEMRKAADGSAVLVDESVTATAYVRTIFKLNEPNSYFYAKGGSLGLGLPAAIGVKLALPERQVICAVGDGSALYSIQALWTAAHYNVAVVFVVFNNASYKVLKDRLAVMQGASMRRGVFTGIEITAPEVEFVALAQSMGLVARRVSCGPELRPALDWALGQKGPALLDVATTRD